MVVGNPKKITLSSSSFKNIINKNQLYVDKTTMIEKFLNESSEVHLIARQRRLGKSLNMDMLKCFLTDKEDNRHLFKGLYIESSPVWEMANSAPVFCFDFKELTPDTYKDYICDIIYGYIKDYCLDEEITRGARRYLLERNIDDPKGLMYLTETVYNVTGKRSYILIDEYDRMLVSNYLTSEYDNIRNFATNFFSAGLKGNPYLEKALLTGVLRISKESLFSGLNNVKVFDVFNDSVYTGDYGLTEKDIDELSVFFDFNEVELKKWYNGIMINGTAIYNTYSVMSFLEEMIFKNYWTMSGVMDIITKILTKERVETIAKLMAGEKIEARVTERISVKDIATKPQNQDFYSLLVQSGYLAVESPNSINDPYILSIPNKELIWAWKDFILKNAFEEPEDVLNIFRNNNDLKRLAEDLEAVLCDRLSYHDLATPIEKGKRKYHERLYHICVLMLLCAYGDSERKYPTSNKESGDGRYDICLERKEAFYIVEIKYSTNPNDLEKYAKKAVEQINEKRYHSNIKTHKRLIKIGIACHGKQCKVICKY